MIEREQVVKEARRLLGTPFHHQARLPGVGVDCVGLLVCVARALGIPIKDCTDYSRDADGETLMARMREQFIPVEDWQIGDILVFRVPCRGLPRHVGIVTEAGIIHAIGRGSAKKVAEHGLDARWRRRIEAPFRFPGVE